MTVGIADIFTHGKSAGNLVMLHSDAVMYNVYDGDFGEGAE